MPPKTPFRKAITSSPEPTAPVGRTPWDLLAMYGRWTLLLIPLAVLGVLYVHIQAACGSEVDILGIKYNKEKCAPPTENPEASDGYSYPRNEKLWVNMPVVILDGNLHVRRLRNNKNKDTLHLSGANISELKAAARDHFARPVELIATETDLGKSIVLNGPDLESYIEVEYKARYFSIDVTASKEQPQYQVTVAPLKAPTRDLKAYFN